MKPVKPHVAAGLPRHFKSRTCLVATRRSSEAACCARGDVRFRVLPVDDAGRYIPSKPSKWAPACAAVCMWKATFSLFHFWCLFIHFTKSKTLLSSVKERECGNSHNWAEVPKRSVRSETETLSSSPSHLFPMTPSSMNPFFSPVVKCHSKSPSCCVKLPPPQGKPSPCSKPTPAFLRWTPQNP
ncbi:uncharacterized protein B0H64DRAFT_89765 [Chaetomium fimeti]|uniref:Uncharacterized protein n=1 Tax=Chaetomium fimeti TaxID=1854472 RepID=A0AAE0LWC2_9PEZI|nr:hypothetical protein B0H64DRAFT_89765 [Chaetomium fimeti]